MLKQQLMRSAYFQRVVLGLLGFALWLRVLLPVGFMPDMAALSRGFFQLTVCSAYGAQDILVDAQHHKIGAKNNLGHTQPNPHQSHKDGAFCPFGSIPIFTPLAHIVLLALAVFIFAILLLPEFAQQIATIVNRAAQARAPPVLLA